ncbi:aromatic ring-hydroxylating dioxygenase subunit alpha [soil metagenome]
MTAFFTDEQLAPVTAPEGEGGHLPVRAYLDEDVALWEAEHIWANGWVCVASVANLSRRGDHLARPVGNRQLVINRAADGTIQAFHNVCQHRGCRLVEDGNHHSARMVCPYHAWIYDHDGKLKRAPYTDILESEDADRFDLVPVRTEVAGGLVFVDCSGSAPPLADEAAPILDVLERYGVAELKIGARWEDEVAANWKVVAENALECNHCNVVHPELNDLAGYLTADESVGPGPIFESRQVLSDDVQTISMDGTTNGRPLLPGLRPEEIRMARFIHHFPGLSVSCKPDGVTLFWYYPEGASKTVLVQEMLFAPEVIDQGMDVSDAVEFTQRVARQDWVVLAQVQRGLASQGYTGGVYSSIEGRAHAFDKFIEHAYRTGERPLQHSLRIRTKAEKGLRRDD